MKRHFLLLLLLAGTGRSEVVKEGAQDAVNLIPLPARVTPAAGVFMIRAATLIDHDAGAAAAARWLRAELQSSTGMDLALKTAPAGTDAAIVLRLDPNLEGLGPEGYHLEIAPRGLQLAVPSPAGLFYGCQTLCQLLPSGQSAVAATRDGRWSLPCLAMDDRPRFAWRGLMLDCSRTFQSLDYLRKTLDRMACYKLNTLHLHLTDDQGWRLEIRKHPDLTKTGARFAEQWQEPAARQGFYTQTEMKELVRYAAARHINPFFPALRSGRHLLQRPSPQKQILSRKILCFASAKA
jgi:hexosaminidase